MNPTGYLRLTTIWIAAIVCFCSLGTRGDDRGWFFLSNEEKRPEKFEPFLQKNPADEVRRTAALVWYSREEKGDVKRLQLHTRQMIENHPHNTHIYYANGAQFYVDPTYRLEVIKLLEEQVEKGRTNHAVFANLARICKQGAIPPVSDPKNKERFLQYYELPSSTKLPTKIDRDLADKAVRHFQSAIAAAGNDTFYPAFYAEGLVEILIELDRLEEAIVVCESMVPKANSISKPDFLVTYGRCLKSLKRMKEAKEVFGRVRESDKEGNEDGPAHATTNAELELGLIALESKDLKAARQHLLGSVNVQQCCHNTTQGVSLKLAEKLLEEGDAESVIAFCDTALEKFGPNKATQALMQRAISKKNR